MIMSGVGSESMVGSWGVFGFLFCYEPYKSRRIHKPIVLKFRIEDGALVSYKGLFTTHNVKSP